MKQIKGKIESNLLQFDTSNLKEFLDKNNGKKIILKVDEGPKSQNQLGYLFGVIYPLFLQIGYTDVEEVHEVMKMTFLSYRDERGKLRYRGLSERDHEECANYITRLVVELLNEGIDVPEPDPNWRLNNYNTQAREMILKQRMKAFNNTDPFYKQKEDSREDDWTASNLMGG